MLVKLKSPTEIYITGSNKYGTIILFSSELENLIPDDRIIEVQPELDYYVLGNPDIPSESFKILEIWVEEII